MRDLFIILLLLSFLGFLPGCTDAQVERFWQNVENTLPPEPMPPVAPVDPAPAKPVEEPGYPWTEALASFIAGAVGVRSPGLRNILSRTLGKLV